MFLRLAFGSVWLTAVALLSLHIFSPWVWGVLGIIVQLLVPYVVGITIYPMPGEKREKMFASTIRQIAKHSLPVLRCYNRLPLKATDDPVEFALNSVIRPYQIPNELRCLANIIAELQPKYAMEIGTRNGGTLFILCQLAHPEATIISLDLPDGNYGGGYSRLLIPLFRKFRQPEQDLILLRQDSHLQESFETVRAFCSSLDYLFIDGDHSYAGVRQDFEKYSQLVRKGGIVLFHDILADRKDPSNHVHRFWNEIKHSYHHEVVIENPQQGWGGIGILYV